jgi:TolA-binding protein
MMKFGFAINAVVGAALVATTVGLPQGDAADLQISLDGIVRELETLAGLRERIDRGDRDAIADVLKHSTTPAADAAAEDQRLNMLRVEVARLEMQRDALPAPLPKTPEEPKGKPKNGAKVPAPDPNLTAFEAAGFSADVVKQGEVLFRAEKFADCVKVLEKAPDDPRAKYWTARSLERMGRSEDALAIYTQVAAAKDAGWAAERARADLEYLQWKKSLEGTTSGSKKEPQRP